MWFRKIQVSLIWFRNMVLDAYFWPRSHREFLSRLNKVKSSADAVDLIYDYQGGGFYRSMYPNQDRIELKTLAERVDTIAPEVIVEIGTRDGGTLFTWSQCGNRLKLLVSIDLPGGIHGGGYPASRAKLYHLFTTNRSSCTLDLLRLDSQTEATKARLIEILQGRQIDFLFIDGDHRYPGVKKDYELYAPLVRPGGLIAFHDIRPNPQDATIQVYKLWDELKVQGKTSEEIINEPYRGRYGIGVIVANP